MKISDKGVELIQRFEGCRLTTYPDPGTGGAPWTCGWGHTGPEVVKGLRITQHQADTWLRADLVKFETAVIDMITTAVRVEQCEFDALVSFAYNCGPDALRRSTLMRKYLAGDKAAAAEQFLRWTKAGGKELPGLLRRRLAERDHFLGVTK